MDTKTILIIDDDPGYMQLVRQWLKENYKVAMVTSGSQAFRWFEKNTADLILLDYEMPVENGPRVFMNLRQKENIADIPVMFLTGNNDEAILEELQNLQHQGILLKTMSKDELVDKLSEFFSC
ncbi:response regulator [Butyrivibrio sp. MC2021]|uniref:response regulator n=1 Tax=Butyrivibrio sp. MC2021 TaxID=1408306 RepID=UPI0006879A26|nr:response regulator [Butyrivibrio sp. MC2021]